jgi:large subunit ribosomal protein L10
LRLDQKKEIVAELSDKFARSKVIIVTDYKGLDVTTMNELRRALREGQIEYKVVKNSLLTRAAKGTDIEPLVDAFSGPNAIALSYDDPVAPAKLLTKFAANHDKLEIKAGIMDGQLMDLNAIKALSSLPSREELLGQVLATMNAVPTGFVRALNDNIVRLLNVLQAVKEQKEAA